MTKGALPTILALCLFAAPVAAASNFNAFLGSKGLDEDDWVADAHGEYGLLIDFAGPNWPINVAVDFLRSSGDFDGLVYRYDWGGGFDLRYYEEEVRTQEFAVGVRKYWHAGGNMYPYVGGGITFVELEAESRYEGEARHREDGSGEGLWFGGGIQWRLGQANLGFSIRFSGADVDLESGNYPGGGGHAGLLLGFNL